MRTPSLTLAAGLAAVALAGCGSSGKTERTTTAPTRTVETTTIESQMEQQLSTADVKVTKASCPSTVEAAVGTSFTCSVSWSNGATGKVKVTHQTVNRYTYEPVSGSVQVPGATVEKSLQEDLAKQGVANAAVNCPDNIIVKLGTTVTCDVTSASGKAGGTVTFTFASAEGTIDPSSVQTG